MTYLKFLCGAAVLAAFSGCGSGHITVCPADLRIGVAPSDTTIAVGGQFTPRVTILGCAGTKVLTDSLTWTSSDPSTAAVGATSGLIIGARPGLATVEVAGETYARIGAINVTVR